MPDNIEDDEKRKSYSNNKAKETLERYNQYIFFYCAISLFVLMLFLN